MNTLRHTAILLFALMPAAVTQAAPAAQPKVHVSYADLDLRTPAGTQLLDRRLARAVRNVCGGYGSASDMIARIVMQDCVQATTAKFEPVRDRIVARAAGKAVQTANSGGQRLGLVK